MKTGRVFRERGSGGGVCDTALPCSAGVQEMLALAFKRRPMQGDEIHTDVLIYLVAEPCVNADDPGI